MLNKEIPLLRLPKAKSQIIPIYVSNPGLWIRNDLFSDPTPDPTFEEVSAPTPDSDPVSNPATLVSASRELRGKLALYS
jgi:hypothetical protein